MAYQRPFLEPVMLTLETASCRPVPPERCENHQGLVRLDNGNYVGFDHSYVAGQCFEYPQGIGPQIQIYARQDFLVDFQGTL